MEYFRHHALSCGVIQITGLYARRGFDENSKFLKNEFLNAYMEACNDNTVHPAHAVMMFSTVIFSDRERSYGSILAEQLEEMGTITRSPFVMNPNSGNRIAVWVWNPSQETKTLLRRRITEGREYPV
jgi:hypothetical protein